MFIVECQKNQARVRQTEPITSGSQNVYVVQFRLSEEWDPLVATAVFMASNRIVNVLLDEDRECMIPWEVMQYAGEQVMVGVFGTMNGNVILPTIWASMGNLQQGVTTGIYPTEPTPEIYLQLVDQLNRLRLQIEKGIPYSIDGIIDTNITSYFDLSDYQLPRQVILLNSSIGPEDDPLHYNNGIVHLEDVDYLDENNQHVYGVRLTDYDGNVYDLLYDNYDPAAKFIKKIQIRNGDIRNDYELARSEGFTGTLAEWLESLKGADGKDGKDGENGLDALWYTGNAVTINGTANVSTAKPAILTSNFNRQPIDGDVLMVPVIQNSITYYGIYQVENITETTAQLNPKLVTRVTPQDGKDGADGLNPLYYIGPVLLLKGEVMSMASEQDTVLGGTEPAIPLDENQTISNDQFTRTPVEGDVVTIPVYWGQCAYLIAYSVGSVREEESVLSPVNYMNTTGPTGAPGEQALWASLVSDNKPKVNDTMTVEYRTDASGSGGIMLSAENDYTTPFNRLPIRRESFSGMLVSSDPENNPFTCYVSGIVVKVSMKASQNVSGGVYSVTVSFDLVSDIAGGGSSFELDLMSSEDVDAVVDGDLLEGRPNAALGAVGLNYFYGGIKEIANRLFETDLKSFTVSAVLLNPNWVENSSDKGKYCWTYTPDIRFSEENIRTQLYYVRGYIFVNGVETYGAFINWENTFVTDGNGDFRRSVIFYSDAIPTENVQITVLYTASVLSELEPGFTPIIVRSPSVAPPEYGGTGQTTLESSMLELMKAVPYYSNHSFSYSTDRIPIFQSSTNEIAQLSLSSLLIWATGRSSSLTSAGTDYTTARSRAISLTTTAPTSGVNGCLYGVYS